jgi:hypothetical protein
MTKKRSGTRRARPASRRDDPSAGLILREKAPQNLESPHSALREWITPSDQFYVRNHFTEPDLKRAAWRLRIEGAIPATAVPSASSAWLDRSTL